MVSGTELSRASCSVTKWIWAIHELNFKLSKYISWKASVISHQNCLSERKDFTERSCSNAMLSQVVWVNLRLCISKKFQEMQVLLALATQSESQGIRKQAGEGEQAGNKRRGS